MTRKEATRTEQALEVMIQYEGQDIRFRCMLTMVPRTLGKWRLDLGVAMDPVPVGLVIEQGAAGVRPSLAMESFCAAMTAELQASVGHRLTKVQADRLDLGPKSGN